jgi:hypothetical protein
MKTISLTSEDDPVGMVRRSLHKLNAGEVLPMAHGLLEESLQTEIKESNKLLMGQLPIFVVHKIEQEKKRRPRFLLWQELAPISNTVIRYTPNLSLLFFLLSVWQVKHFPI